MGEGAGVDESAGDGKDMAVGDDSNKGAEDSVDVNVDNADEDVAFTWEQVVRAGPITCCTKESDIYLRESKCERQAQRNVAKLCDGTQFGSRKHTIRLMYLPV